MTSRSHREQLFTSRTADQTNVQQSQPGGNLQLQPPAEFQGNTVNENDPLQLEHMLGYAGEYRKTCIALPGNDQLYVKRLVNPTVVRWGLVVNDLFWMQQHGLIGGHREHL